MDLAKFQVELRPRHNNQALDLGFALLHAQAGPVYKAWLLLWLGLAGLCASLHLLFGLELGACLLLAWWLRPLCERATLYMLSRLAFGERVSWGAALRAWPRQLGGGWLAMLTWQRPFAAGRGLYQPIWLLEQARGAAARARRQLIARKGTGRAAISYGVACAVFELVLQCGLLAFLAMFLGQAMGEGEAGNVISQLARLHSEQPQLFNWLLCASYAAGVAIVGPIYTACCFTLYLNRRATLEAWDIEIMLRQLAPAPRPPTPGQGQRGSGLHLLLTSLLALALLAPALPPAHAAATATAALPASASASATVQPQQCPPAPGMSVRSTVGALIDNGDQGASPAQAPLRRELAQLYASAPLRGYVCEQVWRRIHPDQPAPPPSQLRPRDVDWPLLAAIIKYTLIISALGLAGWLLYRYRDHWPRFAMRQRPQPAPATAVAGLDIRAETLPDDVAAAVRRLWADGAHRAALALLYRATLSRLLHQHGVALHQGATEGECLQLARAAAAAGRLSAPRLAVAGDSTALWLNGAYGGLWPDGATLEALCQAWQAQFGAGAAGSTP